MTSFELMKKWESVTTPSAARDWIDLCLQAKATEGEAMVNFMLGEFLWIYHDLISGEEVRERFGLKSAEFHFRMAYEDFLERANNGCGHSAMMVASFYQQGLPPVHRDNSVFLGWLKRAADLGFEPARRELSVQLRRDT